MTAAGYFQKKSFRLLLLASGILLLCGVVSLFLIFTPYQIGVLVLRGGAFWQNVLIDDPKLTPSMRLALSNSPQATTQPVFWSPVENGFETASMAVLVDGAKVDSIELLRFDPAKFQFIVRNDPSGMTDLEAWMRVRGVVAAINGSYYGVDGKPDTPIVSEKLALGPVDYQAKGGAFVSSPGQATVVDLSSQDWKPLLSDAENAMVSYPLLVGNGENRVRNPSKWLANRSFVAVDKSGRVILGSTKDAFFSLYRLADFLKSSPSEIVSALNLDGGPLACLGVRPSPNMISTLCGDKEVQVTDDKISLLRWPWGHYRLPMILLVVPK